MSRSWHVDLTAPNRAVAIDALRHADLPFLACTYLVAVIEGENYVHTGRINPDRPIHIWGNGQDHGSYIDVEAAGLEYEQAAQ